MKKPLILTGVFLALLVSTSIQCWAKDFVFKACVNNSSEAMRFVGELCDCNRWETPVTWNQVGPQGPPGIPNVGALKVYSADGDYLGLLVNSSHGKSDGNPNSVTVYVSGLKKLFQFDIEGDQMSGGFGHNTHHPVLWPEKMRIHFESTNCGGTPYIGFDELFANEGSHNMYYFIVTYEGMDVIDRHYEAIYYPQEISMQSRHDLWEDYCEKCQGTVNSWFKLKEVFLPFKYPVKLPLTFE